MTREDLELTKKYLPTYSSFCNERECGEECPVFVRHEQSPQRSCFMTYCDLCESGTIQPGGPHV